MSEEVLQQAPEYSQCRSITDGICVLKDVVEKFFNNREFFRTELTDMFPCGFEVRIGNAATSIPETKARPSITMARSDINLKPLVPYSLSAANSSVVSPGFSVVFEIKTPNYRMTELMSLELGQFLITFTPYLRSYKLNLAGVICGSTRQFRETTPNYFFSQVTVTASVPLTVWKYTQTETILRSLELQLRMHNSEGSATELI